MTNFDGCLRGTVVAVAAALATVTARLVMKLKPRSYPHNESSMLTVCLSISGLVVEVVAVAVLV